MEKANKSKSTKSDGKNKVRPRAGEWGFLVRGKNKPQGQKLKSKREQFLYKVRDVMKDTEQGKLV